MRFDHHPEDHSDDRGAEQMKNTMTLAELRALRARFLRESQNFVLLTADQLRHFRETVASDDDEAFFPTKLIVTAPAHGDEDRRAALEIVAADDLMPRVVRDLAARIAATVKVLPPISYILSMIAPFRAFPESLLDVVKQAMQPVQEIPPHHRVWRPSQPRQQAAQGVRALRPEGLRVQGEKGREEGCGRCVSSLVVIIYILLIIYTHTTTPDLARRRARVEPHRIPLRAAQRARPVRAGEAAAAPVRARRAPAAARHVRARPEPALLLG